MDRCRSTHVKTYVLLAGFGVPPDLEHFQEGSYRYRSLIQGLYIPYRSLFEAQNTLTPHL